MNKEIRDRIYTDLLELSSKKIQSEYWLNADSERISSYVELMNRLFDDSDIRGFIKKIDNPASKVFVMELNLLIKRLEEYDEGNKTQLEIINDPDWNEIRNQAKTVISLWNNEKIK